MHEFLGGPRIGCCRVGQRWAGTGGYLKPFLARGNYRTRLQIVLYAMDQYLH